MNATIHYRGKPAEQTELPTVPRAGDLLADGDGLWRVVCVVFGDSIDAYAVRAAAELGGELAAWSDQAAPAEATQEQRGLFHD